MVVLTKAGREGVGGGGWVGNENMKSIQWRYYCREVH